jgi:hypothetical protein
MRFISRSGENCNFDYSSRQEVLIDIFKALQMTFAEKIISFLKDLDFNGTLPEGISLMNPFRDDKIISAVTKFYEKFYNDHRPRYLILGVNPGRFGAGVTGIPFTDTIRLYERCGIHVPGIRTFEPSSVFVYEVIEAYGGPLKFYSEFYISALSPLGFTSVGSNGKQVNYNYYDNKKLTDSLYEFIVQSLEIQLHFGIKRDVCFCLGTGKNFNFLQELNNRFKYFDRIIPLEHPRYIMQYKTKQKPDYIVKYKENFKNFC